MSEIRRLTLTDKRNLEAKLEELMEAKRQEEERIQAARGFDDLSENAEYSLDKNFNVRLLGLQIHEIERLLRTSIFEDDSPSTTDGFSPDNANIRQLTLTDKRRLEAELEDLVECKRRMAEGIQVARGFGKIRKNGEYDGAKKEQARLYGRIAEIEYTLRNAVFVDDSATGTYVVSLGTVVRVFDMEYEEEDEYTLVGFTEADPSWGYISNESPIGQALMDAHVGDIVEANTPSGKIKLKILEIRKR